MALGSRIVLRWSWALLFVWFGVEQLVHPAQWTSFLPVWTGYFPIPGEMLIQLNGWLELVLAVCLFAGFSTRLVSGVLAVHLAGIAISVGGAIGVRDLALAAAGAAIALDAPDAWTLDKHLHSSSEASR